MSLPCPLCESNNTNIYHYEDIQEIYCSDCGAFIQGDLVKIEELWKNRFDSSPAYLILAEDYKIKKIKVCRCCGSPHHVDYYKEESEKIAYKYFLVCACGFKVMSLNYQELFKLWNRE
ncbi:MAG: hypothetical protein GF387_00100 [Candidatus Portnoybacteria bacterium]|nr:hypothetical protein [Candidatus Portnoybacteria bacterium]